MNQIQLTTFSKKFFKSQHRQGFALRELLVVLVILGLLCALLSPQILAVRESARQDSCKQKMSQLGKALQSYIQTHHSLPPAAIWGTNGMRSLGLHVSKQLDRFSYANWALLILPHTEAAGTVQAYNGNLPVTHPQNIEIITTPLSLLSCPSDSYNRSKHRFESSNGKIIELARGNYAINGGTHTAKIGAGSTSSPTSDYAHLSIDRESNSFQYWGNGIAGFNKSFHYDDFTNGSSHLVALEEIRAGIHPVDPRGVWGWGHIGSSVTWAHGVNGDDYGPNNSWDRADDIIGCSKLHKLLGTEKLVTEKMGCPSYIDQNLQATSRSQHSGGVNVLFLDGTVKFIADQIDPGLWHVIHSRDTPDEILATNFERRLYIGNILEDAAKTSNPLTTGSNSPAAFSNSMGMKFTLIPAGQFQMGLADRKNNFDLPPETPQHRVQLTTPFYLGCHEVTQSEYQRIMGDNPASHQSDSQDTSQFPIEQVSWNEAHLFCKRLSEVKEEQKAGRTYRLPTEAEWEYACRTGSDSPYIFRKNDAYGEMAGRISPLPVTQVGSYQPNKFGLYDMRGNVWEWCSDWFDRDYYSRSPSQDPQGPESGYFKVVRGGDWIYRGEFCKINYPITAPWNKNPFIGFRVVCDMNHN
ncbi:Serine/threonine-protein kinase pkn1 [Gimesia alba]|uniref:Serine/threonine-protein kinase pkn1 n=1 Tax=Gimesia alba TaxID=2527973 RepID=A0A517RK56_9PLAN|nr:SUMF1/EgtB/PvdO family nonheme iron enzyme [Gimesia alba]QDT44267.1 Serine/threonine-protein kinase pkn1 [Gimesia alba]